LLAFVALGFGLGFSQHGFLSRRSFFEKHPGREAEPEDQSRRDSSGGGERQPIAPNQLLEPINAARWPCGDFLLSEMTLDVSRQSSCAVVTAGAILLEAFDNDPIEIATQQ